MWHEKIQTGLTILAGVAAFGVTRNPEFTGLAIVGAASLVGIGNESLRLFNGETGKDKLRGMRRAVGPASSSVFGGLGGLSVVLAVPGVTPTELCISAGVGAGTCLLADLTARRLASQ